MGSRSAEQAVQGPDLLRLREPIRRYLARHTDDEHELEDLVQETLARVWEARRRVDRRVAASYAVATARNLLLSERRSDALHRRHEHRLHEATGDVLPEESVLLQEERQAAAEAVAALEGEDRELLYRQYAPDPREPGDGAAVPRPPGMRSRLAQVRSRGRVNYLLALRHIELPTARCRPVLEALSSGDNRRQQRVGVDRHLVACTTCAGCARALVGRRRALFGILPAPLLVLVEPLRRARARAPRTTTAVAAGLVVLAVGTAAALAPDRQPAPAAAPGPPPPAPAPPVRPAPGSVTLGGVVVPSERWATGQVTAAAGATVVGTAVPVQSVPDDEGFWVGAGDRRFWVQLQTAGESPQAVHPGDVVSFTGRVEQVTPQTAPGLDADEGRAQLVAQRAYVSVSATDLRQQPAPNR